VAATPVRPLNVELSPAILQDILTFRAVRILDILIMVLFWEKESYLTFCYSLTLQNNTTVKPVVGTPNVRPLLAGGRCSLCVIDYEIGTSKWWLL